MKKQPRPVSSGRLVCCGHKILSFLRIAQHSIFDGRNGVATTAPQAEYSAAKHCPTNHRPSNQTNQSGGVVHENSTCSQKPAASPFPNQLTQNYQQHCKEVSLQENGILARRPPKSVEGGLFTSMRQEQLICQKWLH